MDKKNLVKNIISKTILFIFILLFVGIFKSLFGTSNTCVGITTVIALLMLLGKDLTKNPIKNFSIILGINLALGVGAFISASNIWLGIIINFLTLSLIGYFFSYNLTKGLILPFGLQYLFMLTAPVYGGDFAKRIGALILGAIFIMISQFIVNAKKKNNFKKENSIIGFNHQESDDVYKNVHIFGKDIKIHPVRASYALRIGILTAVTAFLVFYFKLQEGRWMVYTIFSLTELYSEHCKIRAKKRVEGTIIGVLIVIVAFMFIKNPALRGIIILIAGYLNSFAADYRDIIVLATVSAITPLAITNGSIEVAIKRLFYVVAGTILALLANRFILRKSEADSKLK